MGDIQQVERPAPLQRGRLPVGAVEAVAATLGSDMAAAIPLDGGRATPHRMRNALQQVFYRNYPTLQLHTRRVHDTFVCWVTTRTKPTPNGTGAPTA